MKIVIICPRYEGENCPPYGVGCLVAYIRKNNPYVDIDICDYYDIKNISQVINYNEYDIIGFSFIMATSQYCYDCTKEIKNINKDIIILHGGSQATIAPNDSLLNGADIVIRGEGEETFSELIDLVKKNKHTYKQYLSDVKGISYQSDGEIFSTQDRAFIDDLDKVPWPDWSSFDFTSYDHTLHDGKGFALPIMGSRGCAYNCSFCCSPKLWKRCIRFRSPRNVVDEIKHNIGQFGITRYHFYDDDFFSNPDFVKELCTTIINENIQIEYAILGRSNTINKNSELLPLISKSGCILVEFGIESVDSNVLKNMNKQITVEEIEQTQYLLRQFNINMQCLYMFCFPGETIKSIRDLNICLNKAYGTEGKVYHQHFFIPYMGTEIYNNHDLYGIMVEDDISRRLPYNNIVFIPNSILNQHPCKLRSMTDHEIALMLSYREFVNKLGGYKKTKQEVMSMYNRFDGKRSIIEIANELIANNKFDRNTFLKYIYIWINLMAQMGLIKDVQTE